MLEKNDFGRLFPAAGSTGYPSISNDWDRFKDLFANTAVANSWRICSTGFSRREDSHLLTLNLLQCTTQPVQPGTHTAGTILGAGWLESLHHALCTLKVEFPAGIKAQVFQLHGTSFLNPEGQIHYPTFNIGSNGWTVTMTPQYTVQDILIYPDKNGGLNA